MFSDPLLAQSQLGSITAMKNHVLHSFVRHTYPEMATSSISSLIHVDPKYTVHAASLGRQLSSSIYELCLALSPNVWTHAQRR